ncbi:MAG: uncharacterized protein H6R15_2279 [Proteobacteria bacterium]|nr:uncharacterized protein [Pseudomonadota bacterium]
MTDTIRQFIIQLLLEKGPLPSATPIGDYSYLDSGHIDSLAFIKFVFRLEEQFGIQLAESDIVSPRIRTVDGLAGLIAERLAH